MTTKMRILPANFEALEEAFVSVGAQMIHDYKVPPDLVYGQDETNAQFVSRPKKTRAELGAKRVRLLGVCRDRYPNGLTFKG